MSKGWHQEKRRVGKAFGLQVSNDDLTWLERAAKDGGLAIPGFSRSRLIAMALVEPANGALLVTERGKGLWGSRNKTG